MSDRIGQHMNQQLTELIRQIVREEIESVMSGIAGDDGRILASAITSFPETMTFSDGSTVLDATGSAYTSYVST